MKIAEHRDLKESAKTMHLTEDQIDDFLIGGPAELAEDAAAHLAACEECGDRLNAAAAPIASFKAVTMAWSERRSATMPPVPFAEGAGWRPFSRPSLAWGSAAAALVVALVVPAVRYEQQYAGRGAGTVEKPVLMASTGPVSTLNSEEQIDNDNQMLRAIDRELTSPVETPAALGLQPAASHARSRIPLAAVAAAEQD